MPEKVLHDFRGSALGIFVLPLSIKAVEMFKSLGWNDCMPVLTATAASSTLWEIQVTWSGLRSRLESVARTCLITRVIC